MASNQPAAEALADAPVEVRESVPLVFAGSDFVAQLCARDEKLLPALLAGQDLQRKLAPSDFRARAPSVPTAAGPLEAEVLSALRRWRRREMVRIAWRDLAGWADLPETLADLSAFADAAIEFAVEHARRALVAMYGEPLSAEGVVQPLVVLAMGKLGGEELNFSSDVDLMFLFPEHGETAGPRKIANEEFFTRLGQAVIRLLETPTYEGSVLRVDMRLRPFGDSGPLVASFASFEDYLPRHGRDWERYAYVKARAVTAPDAYAALYASTVRPFVYRRYLDYGVFESLREMKALIEREVQRRELADNIKLGPGGIREIEFVVQAFQLIRGGQDRRLQTPSIQRALALLGTSKMLPPGAVVELWAAYFYLRRLENRLQMLGDAQAHRLPADALTRERIALSMNAPDWGSFLAELNKHRERVIRQFRLVVFGGARQGDDVRIDLGRFWETQEETAALAESLARAGFGASGEAARLLLELRGSMLVRKLDEPGRKRLQALLPPLLADIARGTGSHAQSTTEAADTAELPAAVGPPDAVGLPGAVGAPKAVGVPGAAAVDTATAEYQLQVLRRVLRIIEAIGQRSAYFALLQENAVARARLVELCGHGDFLTQQMASHPLLLDELIDERLAELPDRETLEAEVRSRLEQLSEDDPEHQVEALCRFQRAAIFRVAVADLTGRLPVMRVSDRLTEIAEVIVERAIELGWRQISAQFGTPMCGEGAERRPVRIAVVGYGKLGGMELGYSSDLDLVFLHDSQGERQETTGTKPTDNQVFFVRLAQRIMHLLTMHSAAGRLYEVDLRLRPSGKGGLLVTSINAFAEYQRTEAWTWEHQALLHARGVAGAKELRARFEEVRLDILANHVRRDTLRDEVRSMRERMRKELSKGGAPVPIDVAAAPANRHPSPGPQTSQPGVLRSPEIPGVPPASEGASAPPGGLGGSPTGTGVPLGEPGSPPAATRVSASGPGWSAAEAGVSSGGSGSSAPGTSVLSGGPASSAPGAGSLSAGGGVSSVPAGSVLAGTAAAAGGTVGLFDIKQDAGGVADIEFLAQYWALCWAKDYPPVVLFSDTIRQLESVASADLVPQATVDTLTSAYRAFRTRSHHLSLAGAAAIVPATEFVAERAAVTRVWNEAMGV